MKTKDELLLAISQIDFSLIRQKLMKTQGWDTETVDHNIKLYRQFLYLAGLRLEVRLVPTKDIDEVWHMHILDTKKYHKDCMSALGFFLHHCPTYGKGKKSARNFAKTIALFEEHFGKNPLTTRSGLIATCDIVCGNGGNKRLIHTTNKWVSLRFGHLPVYNKSGNDCNSCEGQSACASDHSKKDCESEDDCDDGCDADCDTESHGKTQEKTVIVL